MVPGHGETGLSIGEMESFKQKLKPPNNTFLSSVEESKYVAYDTFFRVLAHDLESRRGMFPADFVKITNKIIYESDSSLAECNVIIKNSIHQSLLSIAKSLLPKWFADEVQDILLQSLRC